MPILAIVGVTLAVIGSVFMITQEIRSLRRRKRNLAHWEKNEPLEKVGDWD
jgi:hypothetical protein